MSLLDSVKAMTESEQVPSTLLKEHYRCHPAIIEFCNRMYYGGQLIPMRVPTQDAPDPLAIVYAAPGTTRGGLRAGEALLPEGDRDYRPARRHAGHPRGDRGER